VCELMCLLLASVAAPTESSTVLYNCIGHSVHMRLMYYIKASKLGANRLSIKLSTLL
jgi:hypothetical protein